MAGFARWCFLHRRAVLAVWLIALIGFFGLSQLTGSAYSNSASLPGTDSAKALQVLTTDFPAQAGDSDQIVVQARHGTLRSPAAETAVTSMLARVARLPDVRSVTSPYGPGGQISRDGTIGLATVNLNAQAQNIPNSAVNKLISTAKSADSPLLNVQLGGAAIENITSGGTDYTSVLLGIVLALVVLFFAFRRSVFGALLPVISALVAIAAGSYIVNILTHAISIAGWVPEVAFLVALGVGVDYALFVVSRHRNELLAGQTPEDAAVTALNTSGRAVLLAGLTVCAALLGLFALPDPTLPGVAVTVSLLVGLTMLASLTLLPAMLGFLGPKVLRRAERRMLAQDGRQVEQAGAFWLRWAEGLGRRPTDPRRRRAGGDRRPRHPVPQHARRAAGRQHRPAVLDHLPGLPPAGEGVRPRFQRAPGAWSARSTAPPTGHASPRSPPRPAASRAWPGSCRRSSARTARPRSPRSTRPPGHSKPRPPPCLTGCGPASPGPRRAARWRSTSAAPPQPTRTTPGI